MPRISAAASSSKRQASHHHQGHQNGNPPPMKRPSRSGSASNGSAVPSASTLSLVQQTPNQQIPPADNQFLSDDASKENVSVYGIGWDKNQGGGAFSDGPGDGVTTAFANGTLPPEHSKFNFDPSGRAAIAGALPSTVLPSFPLLDTIMLLILFLQLPPTILTITHFLFASMTFVPPSTTLLSASTASSPPPFTNMLLQGSNGAPSLLTILFADLLVALLSMFLWPSARAFLIDFAQAVIAISLGAGFSSQSGGTLGHTVVCVGVMGCVKVVQSRFRLAGAWGSVSPSAAVLYDSRTAQAASGRALSSSAGWIRSAIAIHIIAQGVMGATRRWLMRSDSMDSPVMGSSPGIRDGSIPPGKQKDKDPEAAAGALAQPMERQNSTSNGKRKKRNQMQTLRKNQPLWTTIASVMVHVAKEVELSKISSASSNPNALDAGAHEPTSGGEDVRVWVTKIGSTDIGFSAGFLRMGSEGEDGYDMHGVDKDGAFPLFVRVNGIVWPQTEARRRFGSDGFCRESGVITEDVEEWIVDITGLTGATEYDFEFVKKGGRVIYRTSACTLPAPTSSAAAVPPAATKQPSRPLSPITTLLNTLAQANSCLSEQKSRLKVVKKTQKSALSDIRKETEKNRSLLGNDKGDERAFRRILALKESIKRADEETEKMSRKLQELQKVPEKLKAEWKNKKRGWLEERDKLLSTQDRASEMKESAQRLTSAIESEAASLARKKERLSTRFAKLRTDLEKLEQEHKQNIEAREKKEAERETLEKHRHVLEQEFSDAIHRLEQKMVDYRMYSADNWQAFYNYEASVQQSQRPPSTPEGGLPGTNNSNRNSLHISTPPGLVPHQGLYAASSSSLPIAAAPAAVNRTRSSSMFSGESAVANMSEQERPDMMRPLFPRGAGMEQMTMFLPGMMMSGSSLVGSPVNGFREANKR